MISTFKFRGVASFQVHNHLICFLPILITDTLTACHCQIHNIATRNSIVPLYRTVSSRTPVGEYKLASASKVIGHKSLQFWAIESVVLKTETEKGNTVTASFPVDQSVSNIRETVSKIPDDDCLCQ
nr:hypothetical protein CFP56_28372 [Quercus suber]